MYYAATKMYLRACSMVHGWKQSYVFLHVTLFIPSFDLLYLLNMTTSYLGIQTEHFFPITLHRPFYTVYSFPCFTDLLELLTNYSWDQGQNQLSITTEIISSGTLIKLLNYFFFQGSDKHCLSFLIPYALLKVLHLYRLYSFLFIRFPRGTELESHFSYINCKLG